MASSVQEARIDPAALKCRIFYYHRDKGPFQGTVLALTHRPDGVEPAVDEDEVADVATGRIGLNERGGGLAIQERDLAVALVGGHLVPHKPGAGHDGPMGRLLKDACLGEGARRQGPGQDLE